MPIYAYIKIPGIENSESTDDEYGKEWIPIRSIDFSITAHGSDNITEDQDGAGSASTAQPITMLHNSPQGSNTPSSFDSRAAAPDASLDAQWSKSSIKERVQAFEKRAEFIKKAAQHLMSRKRRGRGSELGNRASDASGEITISKQLDATSPKLHQIRMKCSDFASNEYIEGTVEVHICRQVPGEDGGSAVRQVYMGYILRKCLLTEISVNASESEFLEETITLTFERVTSCVRRPKQAALNNVGWDYVAEDTDTPDELTSLTKT